MLIAMVKTFDYVLAHWLGRCLASRRLRYRHDYSHKREQFLVDNKALSPFIHSPPPSTYATTPYLNYILQRLKRKRQHRR